MGKRYGTVPSYQSAEWQRLRRVQLGKEPLCRFCRQRNEVVPARVVDHIRPHRGDYLLWRDPDNLQSLCFTCHSGAKQREEKSGIAPGCDVSGTPLDPQHPWNKPKE